MRFLALLKGGATPEFTAKAFLGRFFDCSEKNGDVCWDIAANFVMDCFEAINLKLVITQEDAAMGFENYQWPVESLRIYVFLYSPILFSPVEQFLYQICIVTRDTHELWLQTYKDNITENYIEMFWTPLELTLHLIAVWRDAYKHLLKEGNKSADTFYTSYFEEPISRINFQLLRGVRYLRQMYRAEMPILDKVCHTLLSSARLGILYPQSHRIVIKDLLVMFHEDFHLFYQFANESVEFYYQTLITQCSKATHQLVFESLMKLLQEYDANNENLSVAELRRTLELTNFMVDPKMINVYYHFIVKKQDDAVVLDVLKFLDVLQSKVVSVDCFSEVFVERILALVFSKDGNIGKKAAKLYIRIMRKRFDPDFIFKHIIEFCYVKINSQDEIQVYVKRIHKYFQPLDNLILYKESLLQTSMKTLTSRTICAHFVVAVFHCLIYKHGLEHTFLKTLLEILKVVKCQITEGILLDVFDVASKTKIDHLQNDLRAVLVSFENCAQNKFVSLETIQYPTLRKWFFLWESFTSWTGNHHKLQESTQKLLNDYNDFKQSVPNILELTNAANVYKYRDLLQRLYLLNESNYLIWETGSVILNDICNGLLSSDTELHCAFYKCSLKFKVLIDVYALELITLSLIKIYKMIQLPNRANYNWILLRIKEVERYLRYWIENTEALTKEPIVRIKSIFICFLELHFVIGSSKSSKILKFSPQIYEILVRLLTYLLFDQNYKSPKFGDYDEDMQMHPKRIISYQRLMIRRFGNFHKFYKEGGHANYVWRFCLYFGLPQAIEFKRELHEFMQILANFNFPIFLRVIPIIVFNLYSKQLALTERTILNAVKAHKTFTDNSAIRDRPLFCVYIVLTVIDRVEKSLQSNTIDENHNRLSSLKHLNKFVDNLDKRKDQGEFIKRINERANNLRQKLLNGIERKTLEHFLNQFQVKN